MKLIKICSTAVMTLAMLLVLGCASTPTQVSAGEAIDDTIITAKVKTAIFNNNELSAAEINVETFKGAVQLSGFVSDGSDVAEAGVTARGVAGVTSVRNNIIVK
jgi:osmotically-inducible protein OsmY